MNHFVLTAIILCAALLTTAQVPINVGIQILKAEDARRYDKTIEDLLSSPNTGVRERAALAAGRIGREEAVPVLAGLLTNDPSEKVRVMAAFAIGEIESIKGADALIDSLKPSSGTSLPNENDAGVKPTSVIARIVEAAGKIAAAHPNDAKSKELGALIIKTLNFEDDGRSEPSAQVIRLGMTAILRARPAGGDETARKFLRSSDPKVVADALNTLVRLRAKNANSEAREFLKNHTDPIIRANSARVLGAAEDKEALDILLNAATSDSDSRVRVAAIRAVASLKSVSAVDRLVDHGDKLLNSEAENHLANKSELLEIATALGRILSGSSNAKALEFLHRVSVADNYSSPESETAIALLDPNGYEAWTKTKPTLQKNTAHAVSAALSALTALAALDESRLSGSQREGILGDFRKYLNITPNDESRLSVTVQADALQAFAAYKPVDLGEITRKNLKRDDPILRATAAGIIADLPKSKENIAALSTAFATALITDKHDNDAQLAIMDALYKLDKKEAVGCLLVALSATDYLVRKKAFELLADKELQKDFPGVPTSLEIAHSKHKDQVLPYSPAFGTKLGQILNSDADYRRALSRKNGSVKAELRTQKGTFRIEFYPEDAPLTVDNFIKLARRGYFNGLEVHRVVPNFVMQDGDPRGDGNGGPGWSIRCEINIREYDRGAVGMALSGKDTGGSQWFVTHSPQPHLDGGYTVFGRVNETDMKIVDSIVRGDRILNVKIIGR